jgi:hypothetical protein
MVALHVRTPTVVKNVWNHLGELLVERKEFLMKSSRELLEWDVQTF